MHINTLLPQTILSCARRVHASLVVPDASSTRSFRPGLAWKASVCSLCLPDRQMAPRRQNVSGRYDATSSVTTDAEKLLESMLRVYG